MTISVAQSQTCGCSKHRCRQTAAEAFSNHLFVTPQDFSQFERQGRMTFLMAFTDDRKLHGVEVHVVSTKCQRFIDAYARIKQELNQRPRPQLKKALRLERQKKSNLALRRAA